MTSQVNQLSRAAMMRENQAYGIDKDTLGLANS